MLLRIRKRGERQKRRVVLKRAILAVSFGTSYRETREKTIGAIENALRGRFAGYEVRRAFTSRMIIKKLAERDHIAVDTVAEAMERLVREGFEEVIVQPTHVMNGYENEDMLAQLERYRGCFRCFAVGEPLLSSGEDYRALARALRAELPDPGEDGGVVLVGHGTDHPANASYAALAHYFTLEGMDKWTVGTVEGEPDAADVRALLRRTGVRRVLLAPLLIVAGDHAVHDIFGKAPSWQAMLEEDGLEVTPVRRGLGEYEGVRELFVRHTDEARVRAERG